MNAANGMSDMEGKARHGSPRRSIGGPRWVAAREAGAERVSIEVFPISASGLQLSACARAAELMKLLPPESLQLGIEQPCRNPEIGLFGSRKRFGQIEQLVFSRALQDPDGTGDPQTARESAESVRGRVRR